MLAKQDRQTEQKSMVEFLARETNVSIDEAIQLYEVQRAELAVSARVTNFLPIFALRNVQEILRKRGSNGRSSGPHGDAVRDRQRMT